MSTVKLHVSSSTITTIFLTQTNQLLLYPREQWQSIVWSILSNCRYRYCADHIQNPKYATAPHIWLTLFQISYNSVHS